VQADHTMMDTIRFKIHIEFQYSPPQSV
jgi:hypothetical protein